jgi:hypothetical protein
MIEFYSFGRMIVEGSVFTSDLIIFPERIHESWWRESGHRLCLQDVEDVFKSQPEVFVVGTGFYGLMKVEEEVRQYAHTNEVHLFIEKTKKAVERFNEISPKKRTVGAFHLTC